MYGDQFRVAKSPTGYRVELCRRGEPYVTFADGLSKKAAETEVRSLTALWAKISKAPSVPSSRAALGQQI
jgi:hypothetical protein